MRFDAPPGVSRALAFEKFRGQSRVSVNQTQAVTEYRSPIGAQDIRDTLAIKEIDLFFITNYRDRRRSRKRAG